jgi:hypothetical protein
MDPPRQPKEVGAMLQEQLAKKGIKMDELDLVLAVMPDGIKNFYEALKRWAEATTGVPVQCCKASKIFGTGGQKKALGTDPQYHAGLLLKLNLKLGGGNVKVQNGLGLMQDRRDGPGGGWCLALALTLALILSRPTMVCGVDVHHPPPGSSRPSWAALVASMDQNCSKWHTCAAPPFALRRIVVGSAPFAFCHAASSTSRRAGRSRSAWTPASRCSST